MVAMMLLFSRTLFPSKRHQYNLFSQGPQFSTLLLLVEVELAGLGTIT